MIRFLHYLRMSWLFCKGVPLRERITETVTTAKRAARYEREWEAQNGR